MAAKEDVPAAQYLRMSTEHQRYSLANQAAAIGVYALERGFRVVRTYQDAGKSGLSLKGRDGLKSLLADVVAGKAEFKALLVLDVSRWGRFQDPDQAAHYEFICREAGIDVRYCGEIFENDGSPASAIMKVLKRISAADYSRELSDKLKRAKRHQAQLGRHGSARAVYGLRRQVVAPDGRPRQILGLGEWKASSADRVVMVHGPEEEIDTVRLIFDLFVRKRLSYRKIAERLREEGRPPPVGGPWTDTRVRAVIICENYTGKLYFGRTAQRLKENRVRNPRERWIPLEPIEPIIPQKLFDRAKKILDERPYNLTDEELLARLGKCFREHGRLSAKIVNECPYLPWAGTFEKRFGALSRAYDLVGFELPGHYRVEGRTPEWPDGQILDGLKRLYNEKGFVSTAQINAASYLPSANCIWERFGSLLKANELAGIPVQTKSEWSRAAAIRGGRVNEGRMPHLPRKPRWPRRHPDGSPFTLEQLTDMLKALLAKRGYLSPLVIHEEPGIPTASYFQLRFGGLIKAYAAAGYYSSRGEVQRAAVARLRPRADTEAGSAVAPLA